MSVGQLKLHSVEISPHAANIKATGIYKLCL